MITKLLGFVGGSAFKKYALIALIPILIGGVWKVYNMGYASAESDYREARDKAEIKLKAKYEKVLKQKDKERNAALNLAEQLRKSKNEVTNREISKVNDSTNCKRLGSKFTSVFNDIVGSPPELGKSVKSIGK